MEEKDTATTQVMGEEAEGEMADKEACCKAFTEWVERNQGRVDDLGTFVNTRALVSMGFKAGWAAAQRLDVWE